MAAASQEHVVDQVGALLEVLVGRQLKTGGEVGVYGRDARAAAFEDDDAPLDGVASRDRLAGCGQFPFEVDSDTRVQCARRELGGEDAGIRTINTLTIAPQVFVVRVDRQPSSRTGTR